MNEKCPKCGSNMVNGRCVHFTQHKSPEQKKVDFIGHVVRADPNIDKEDIRPVEKRKKPDLSIDWVKLQRWMEQ